MTVGFIFWLLMLLWLLLGAYNRRTVIGTPWVWGGDALLFVLIFLLGWQTFGWPIHG